MRELSRAEVTDIPMTWPVVGHEVLGNGAVSDFVNDVVATPDGATMRRQYLLHPGAVGVIAWDDADRIAVVRQYRHPVGYQLVEPPAGLLDGDGETWLTAAKRELAEEVQLRAERWQVLVDLFTTPGANQESLRIYLATGLSPEPAPADFAAEHEEADMEVCWAARADVVDAVLAGRLQNPTMVSGVLALEVARLSGRLDQLRDAASDWPARTAWAAHNSSLAGRDGHSG
ncbi:MAG TPA: NUDIX hydrolase [Propionicimonas sp.]|nr:NUDIX hydrolase [Propionicimonas sp.]HQA77526.1 NUDIX hydrolase [Propionicimonas sp.]HQD96115.1 NUDIX hydrolase [Propionicimonas sp.]